MELTGPVYFVSHGHNVFPSPVLILQGDGVQLRLTGTTVIDNAGIASVTFDALPDLPIGRLELYLPQGPHSVLAAATNLCAPARIAVVKRSRERHRVHSMVKVRRRLPSALSIPTELIAQNGVVVRQNTKVEVSGCASHAKPARRIPR